MRKQLGLGKALAFKQDSNLTSNSQDLEYAKEESSPNRKIIIIGEIVIKFIKPRIWLASQRVNRSQSRTDKLTRIYQDPNV